MMMMMWLSVATGDVRGTVFFRLGVCPSTSSSVTSSALIDVSSAALGSELNLQLFIYYENRTKVHTKSFLFCLAYNLLLSVF